ncbi:MAG: hypothetical protein U0905_02425 [Pirellulales bacterium]
MRDLDWKPIHIVSGLVSAIHLGLLILYPFPSLFFFPLALIALLAVVLVGIPLIMFYASIFGTNNDGKLLIPTSGLIDGVIHFWISAFFCFLAIGLPYACFVIWYTSTHSW